MRFSTLEIEKDGFVFIFTARIFDGYVDQYTYYVCMTRGKKDIVFVGNCAISSSEGQELTKEMLGCSLEDCIKRANKMEKHDF